MELDQLDLLAAKAFEGYIVRKDLALRFRGQYPVPTYVGEFLLGRYCSSINEFEISEGLGIVERQMRERTVRPGEEELFKSRARERGSVKLIDLITPASIPTRIPTLLHYQACSSLMFALAMKWLLRMSACSLGVFMPKSLWNMTLL